MLASFFGEADIPLEGNIEDSCGCCYSNSVGSQRQIGYDVGMASLCYRANRFPAEIIQHAIWLYVRFPLSYRDVEEVLAERGLTAPGDGAALAAEVWTVNRPTAASGRPRSSNRWHLDEM